MRTEIEIQRAHDVLLGSMKLMTQAEPYATKEEDLENISALAGILCWVLQHENEKVDAFEALLKSFVKEAGRAGYKLEQIRHS